MERAQDGVFGAVRDGENGQCLAERRKGLLGVLEVEGELAEDHVLQTYQWPSGRVHPLEGHQAFSTIEQSLLKQRFTGCISIFQPLA